MGVLPGIYGSLILDGISVAPTIVWQSEGASEVNGTWGEDLLIAREGETYNGLGGNDYIMDTGNNTISGGAGDDVILTGAGSNVVYGNDGNDLFITTSISTQTDIYNGGWLYEMWTWAKYCPFQMGR